MRVTPKLLIDAIGCTPERAEQWAPYIDEACAAYEINTPKRIAEFLAQVGHESGSLRYTQEVWGPTDAQRRYEGRRDLGNIYPGDGEKYKGHGLIQVTGRYNHAAARDRLRKRWPTAPDFEAVPDQLAIPTWAARSAADYWWAKNLNQFADAGDTTRISRLINGGDNGLPDRLARATRAQRAVAMAEQPAPVAQAPAPVSTAPTKETEVAPFILAALPALLDAVPSLAKMFDKEGMTDAKKEAIATVAVDAAKAALGVTNAQAVAETLQTKPEAAAAVQAAVQERWFEITEIGGGGIAAARQADKDFIASGARFWQSPSFVAFCLLLPLVYLIMGSVIGLYGKMTLSAEVTASIITGIVTLIIGSGTGYYFGSTTSKNKPDGMPR